MCLKYINVTTPNLVRSARLSVFNFFSIWGGRVMRWCWVNFQCRGVLCILIRIGQGPTALAEGASGNCLDIFSFVFHFSFLSPSLWETVRHRLKYCLKGPLSPKQPTKQIFSIAKPETLKKKVDGRVSAGKDQPSPSHAY